MCTDLRFGFLRLNTIRKCQLRKVNVVVVGGCRGRAKPRTPPKLAGAGAFYELENSLKTGISHFRAPKSS